MLIEGYNPKLDKNVKTLRGIIEQVDGPVLELVRTDSLFPADDDASPVSDAGAIQPEE